MDAEYQTLLRLTPDLRLAVKAHLLSLGGKLVASYLITPESDRELRNAHNPEVNRAADLVQLIQNKVREDPQCYHTFISVLEKNQAQHGVILRKLCQTFESIRQQPQIQVPIASPGPPIEGQPFPRSSYSGSNQHCTPPKQSAISQHPSQHYNSEHPRQYHMHTQNQMHQQPHSYQSYYQQPGIQRGYGDNFSYHQHHVRLQQPRHYQQAHQYHQPRHHQQPQHKYQQLESYESFQRGQRLRGYHQLYQQTQQWEVPLQQHQQPHSQLLGQQHHHQQHGVQQQRMQHNTENFGQTQDHLFTQSQQLQCPQYHQRDTQPNSYQDTGQRPGYHMPHRQQREYYQYSQYQAHQLPESPQHQLQGKYQEQGFSQGHVKQQQHAATNSSTCSIYRQEAQLQLQQEHQQTVDHQDQQKSAAFTNQMMYTQDSGIKRSSHGSEPPHKFQRIERQQMPQSLHSAWQIEQNMCYLPPFGYAVNDENQDHPLLKHRPKLVSFYSHQPEVPEGAWPPVKKTQYINLALIRTEQNIDFTKEYLRETIRGSIDDIMKDKDDIKYDEVFAELGEGARLLFEGRPGCGKTTMMNKVSQDWARGAIPVLCSSLLFLVHLRRFGGRPDVKLEDIIQSTTMDFSDKEVGKICEYIEKNGGKGVVFALDGLDEYCPKKRKETLIHQLIQGVRLPNSIVIVASRPAASQKYRRNATKCIEVLGFLKKQIYEYIDSYFAGNDNGIQGLRLYLRDHPNVMHMCYLPLHIAMITYLYDVEGTSLPQTETEIYRHFTLYTLLRSILKRNNPHVEEPPRKLTFESFDELCQEDKAIFDIILKFAYEATVVKPQQVFSPEDIENIQNSDTGNDESTLGLIVVDRHFVKLGLKEIFTFLHLTFQEFLAACHIARCDSAKQRSIIKEYGKKKMLHVVWKFYCGMTKFADENMMEIFELLYSQTSDSLFHIHCAYESQQECTCSYVVQSLNGSIELKRETLNPADCTALAYVILNSITPTTKLALTSCTIGPEGFTAIVKETKDMCLSVNALSLQGTKIRIGVEEPLCEFLKKCVSIVSLDISKCDIRNKVLENMANHVPELSFLETFDLSENKLGVKSGDGVIELVQKLPKLKHIRLCWFDGYPKQLVCELFSRYVIIQNINGESENFKKSWKVDEAGNPEAHAVAECLQYLIEGQSLNLSDNSISDAGAQALAQGLQNFTNLQTLYLSNSSIGDDGAQALAQGLQNFTNLQTLYLYNNSIGDTGAQALAHVLQNCTNLQTLNLDFNSIGAAGAQALAQGLQNCTNLQSLFLYNNSIGDTGAQALAHGLQNCTNLQVLSLGHNSIGDAGTQVLAQSLQNYTNLQRLDLRYNSLTDSSVGSLSQLIRKAKQLKELDLYGNKFTNDGQTALRTAADSEERKSIHDIVDLDLRL